MSPERVGEILGQLTVRLGGLAAVLYGCYLVGGAGLSLIAGGLWLMLPTRYFVD